MSWESLAPRGHPAGDDFSDGGWCCPGCGKRDPYINLASRRSAQGDGLMCDRCVDKLRVANGFRPQGERDYERFYEQEHLTLDEIEKRCRGYRLTPARYERMLEEQERSCAICKRRPRYTAHLVIDHNHKTGEVRGLLCSNCNTAIGLLKDSPDVLEAAIEYLETRGCYGPNALEESQ